MNKTVAASLLALAIAAATPAFAQGGPGQGPGYGSGWGPGGGWGPGMGYGGGPSYGYGPGGGRGPGWGGGGPGPLAALNLTDDQREKIATIQEDNRRKNWDTMGQMRSEQFKLRQMAFSEKIDVNAITEQQRKVDELRRQMLKSRLETRNQIEAALNAEQRQQFRQFGPWWLREPEGE